MVSKLKAYLEKRWRDHADPIVRFPKIADLAATARDRGWPIREILPESIQSCPGAKALDEDFLRWAEDGRRMLRGHRDRFRGPPFGKNWAAYLHSVRRYKMDRVFTCQIPNARVTLAEGAVLSDREELLAEANLVGSSLRRSRYSSTAPKRKEGRYISLMTIWGAKNMGHFFFDAMLRTALFDDLAGFRFLVPPNIQTWHRGLMEIAGIKPEQLVPADDPLTLVEELVACHIATEGSMPRAEILQYFRARALRIAGAQTSPSGRRGRRIFVDRSGAKRRKLLNQSELEPVLAERGFELVRWEELPMPEQVRIAAEAEIMAGPHGTSLLNSIYSPHGAKVLEIINPFWWDAATLRQCALLDHEFWYCFGENASRDHDTVIAPAKLARVLDYMLDAPVTDPLFDEIAKWQL